MVTIEELVRAAEASDDPIASSRLLQAAHWIAHLQARLQLETGALEQACAAPVDAPLTVEQARASNLNADE